MITAIDTSVLIAIDIDLYVDSNISGDGNFVVNTAPVDATHARDKRAICYLSAGDVESFRPDYQAFIDFDAACGHCLIGERRYSTWNTALPAATQAG